MKKWFMAAIIMLHIFVTGCVNNPEELSSTSGTEPILSYTWMAGESSVASERMGLKRAGVNNADNTISPNGVYFMCSTDSSTKTGEMVSYLLYSDYGSDTVIKLCGRPDCDHENEDCNAYFENGCNICYYNGYLYAAESHGSPASGSECILYRMDTDGGNRAVIFDFTQFAQEQGVDYAVCSMIDSGVCYITTCRWVKIEHDDGTTELISEDVAYYLYKLDGSMNEPQLQETACAPLYHCGDVFLALMNGAQNGGYNDYDFSYGDWNPETDTITYLTDHPGVAGFYGRECGYYFRDGAVICLNYETREEEQIINTGLDGRYSLKCFPDCIVVLSKEMGVDKDNQLYIYNWNYELVDTIELAFSGIPYDQSLIAETSERLIFTDAIMSWMPKYYIEKSEIGTGNAKIHAFSLPDF